MRNGQEESEPADDALIEQLRAVCVLPLTVVGVGNTLKGDDGFGPAVVAALGDAEGITCIDAGTVPENWLGPIARSAPASILIVDAAALGEPPGTLRLVAPDALDDVGVSTHGLPLGFFFDLLAGQCGAPAHLLAAQPEALGFGEGLSAVAQAAARRATDAIRASTGAE